MTHRHLIRDIAKGIDAEADNLHGWITGGASHPYDRYIREVVDRLRRLAKAARDTCDYIDEGRHHEKP